MIFLRLVALVLAALFTLNVKACEQPNSSLELDKKIRVEIKTKGVSKFVEVESPKSFSGWIEPRFSLWGNDESNPVLLYLTSTDAKGKTKTAYVSILGPDKLFEGTEVQVWYSKKGESCPMIATKKILEP